MAGNRERRGFSFSADFSPRFGKAEPELTLYGAVPFILPYPVDDSLGGDTERSFGVRAACCRFPFRKLACERPNRHLNLQASYRGTFQPASLPESHTILDSSFPIDFQPASWLGKKRQQAARTPKLRSACRRSEVHTGTWESGEKSGLVRLRNLPVRKLQCQIQMV